MPNKVINRDLSWKRRSADVGGLHLATENSGQGQGWMGYSGELQYVSFYLVFMARGKHPPGPSLQSY
jgi:hypothetical protein